MDAMNNATTSTTTASATPMVAPEPAPAPAPVSTPMVSSPTPSRFDFRDFFRNINLLEIGFGILGSAALYYTIYYYRYDINKNKGFKSEVENKIDDLDIKISDLQSALQREKQNSQNNNATNFGL
jgi:hypothetical protein